MTRSASIKDLCCLALLACTCLQRPTLAAPAAADAPRVVTYPSADTPTDERGNYYIQLLKLALAKIDRTIEVRNSSDTSGILRSFSRIAAGQGVDVMWAPTSPQRERDYLRVRVPLDKGVLGWRIFLIKDRDRERFAAVQTLDQLKALAAGQVAEWEDAAILRANGLPVVDAMQYRDIFKMLAADRFVYLPRGIGEIQGELRNYQHLGLAIEANLALHYPLCEYFFVARDNLALAQDLETGLQRAIKDGSFERLFQQVNGPAIRAAGLGQRRVFELSNPAATPGSGQDACIDGANSVRALAAPGK